MSFSHQNKTIIINLIVCIGLDNGIGYNNKLPWYIKEDIEYFKQMTNDSIVIMGKNTFSSLGYKPLKNRINIVVSKSLYDDIQDDNDDKNDNNYNYHNYYHTIKESDNLIVLDTFDKAVEKALEKANLYLKKNIFIIGGYNIYKEALTKKLCDFLYITKINKIYESDVYFPYIPDEYIPIENRTIETIDNLNNNIKLSRIIMTQKNEEEEQYLEIIRNLLLEKKLRNNRTGINTLSNFGNKMVYSLKNNKFPLFTTKHTFYRGIVEELLWFLSGSTNSKDLEEKGINIWKDNSSRNFLDKQGFTERKEGDIGPGYGFQWRHYGAEYKGHNADYTNKGIDQISEIIEKIKYNPNDRRIILNAWNVEQIDDMSLPPCHILSQFYVDNDGYLHCQMYQRSADVGLGVPFNVASYSLLTIMLAHCTGLKPGSFIHILGDTHIYENHIEVLKEQIKRIPYRFPKLFIKKNKDENIFTFKYEDFILKNYIFHDTLKMPMAV